MRVDYCSMTSDATLASDPWSWTVDYLVVQICHSQSLFHAAGCRPETFPDAVWLETQLRDQVITGATFLTAFESDALRSELGVQNFGQRVALLSVIKLLRRRSVAYRQHVAMTGVQTMKIADVHTPTIAQPRALSPNHNIRGVTVHKAPKRAEITTVQQTGQAPSQHVTELLITTSDIIAAVDGTGEWDYLVRWQKAEGIAHDENMIVGHAIGDGDTIDEMDTIEENAFIEDDTIEDEEPDELDDFAEEVGNEEDQEMLGYHEDVEVVPGRTKLSRDQIAEIINERIEHYTRTWELNKGIPREDKVEYDFQAMFDKAEAAGERVRLIRAHKNDSKYYGQRLDKLCEGIMKAPGGNAEQIRYQCVNLEITINSMLLADKLVEIYTTYTSESDSEEDEEEEEQRSSNSATTQHARPPQPSVSGVIIDLGSPPESSQEEMEGILVESSPLPEAQYEECHLSSPDRFHTPYSTIVDTVEESTRTPVQQLSSVSPTLHHAGSVTTALPRLHPQLGNEPEKASIASARRWRWPDLVSTQDRKRIVTKALSEMSSVNRETIRSRLTIVGKTDMIREIPACIRMLARNETKMQGVLSRDMPKIVTFTRLFLCWWLCDDYFRVEPSKWRLEELEQCLTEGSPDPSTFYDYLNTIMTTTFNPEALRHPEQPSQAEIIEISDDDGDGSPPPPLPTQRKSQGQQPQSPQRSAFIVLD
jgi:hypothetical protein